MRTPRRTEETGCGLRNVRISPRDFPNAGASDGWLVRILPTDRQRNFGAVVEARADRGYPSGGRGGAFAGWYMARIYPPSFGGFGGAGFSENIFARRVWRWEWVARKGAHLDTALVWSSAFRRFGGCKQPGRINAELQTQHQRSSGAVSSCAPSKGKKGSGSRRGRRRGHAGRVRSPRQGNGWEEKRGIRKGGMAGFTALGHTVPQYECGNTGASVPEAVRVRGGWDAV